MGRVPQYSLLIPHSARMSLRTHKMHRIAVCWAWSAWRYRARCGACGAISRVCAHACSYSRARNPSCSHQCFVAVLLTAAVIRFAEDDAISTLPAAAQNRLRTVSVSSKDSNPEVINPINPETSRAYPHDV